MMAELCCVLGDETMKLRYLMMMPLLMLPLAGCAGMDELTHRYITGPEGGCYYNNDSGNKVYVDRSYCN